MSIIQTETYTQGLVFQIKCRGEEKKQHNTRMIDETSIKTNLTDLSFHSIRLSRNKEYIPIINEHLDKKILFFTNEDSIC